MDRVMKSRINHKLAMQLCWWMWLPSCHFNSRNCNTSIKTKILILEGHNVAVLLHTNATIKMLPDSATEWCCHQSPDRCCPDITLSLWCFCSNCAENKQIELHTIQSGINEHWYDLWKHFDCNHNKIHCVVNSVMTMESQSDRSKDVHKNFNIESLEILQKAK